MAVFTKSRSNRPDALSIIQSVFLLLYFAQMVFPVLSSFGGAVYLGFFCFLCWLVIALIRRPYFVNRLSRAHLVLLFMYFLIVLLPYIFGVSVISRRYLGLTCIFFGTFIFKYYKESRELRVLGFILAIVIFLSLITTITTLSALIKDSHISRSIKVDSARDLALFRQNIGGYTFIYYLPGLSFSFLFLFFASKKALTKILMILGFLLTGYTLIKSNYMTALLIFMIGTLYLVITMAANSKSRTLMGIFAAFGLCFLLVFFDQLSALLPDRITQVISSGDASVLRSIYNEFLGDRWPVMRMSLKTALQHPLLGAIGGGTLSYDGAYLSGFGQHSFFLDTTALYGLPIGITTIVALLKAFKAERKAGSASKLNKALMIYLIIVLLFNNATNSIGLALFVIGPYAQEMVSRREKHEITRNYRKVPAQL